MSGRGRTFEFRVSGNDLDALESAALEVIRGFANGREFDFSLEAEPELWMMRHSAPSLWRARITGVVRRGGPFT